MQAARMARAARRAAIAASATTAFLMLAALPGADAGSVNDPPPIPPIGGSASPSPTPRPEPYEPDDEKLLRLHNEERTEHDRRALKTDASLTSFARRRAVEMASKEQVWHSRNLPAGERWYVVGENVGRAETVEEVFNAFLTSASHRANVFRPGFTSVGIGVSVRGGARYVAVVYGQPWPARAGVAPPSASGSIAAAPGDAALVEPARARTPQGEMLTVAVLVRLVALEQ